MSRFQTVTPDKLRGGYYTPPLIAEALCSWAIRRPGDTVLEPSCGAGVFLEAAIRRLLALGKPPRSVSEQIKGIEILCPEAEETRNIVKSLLGGDANEAIECGDF